MRRHSFRLIRPCTCGRGLNTKSPALTSADADGLVATSSRYIGISQPMRNDHFRIGRLFVRCARVIDRFASGRKVELAS